MNRRELLTGAAMLAGAGQANAFGIGKLGANFGRGGSLGGVSSPAPAALTVNGKVGFIGDSLTGNGFAGTAPTVQFNDNGFTNWGMIFNKGLATMPVGGNQGIPGDNSNGVATRLAPMNALGCKVVNVLIGTNDLASNVAASVTSANIDLIIAGLTAPIIILGTVVPRFGTGAFTSPQETQRGLLNTAIRAKASSRVLIADYDAATTWASGHFAADGIHWNALGAYVAGKTLGVLLQSKQLGTIADFEALFHTGYNPNDGFAGSGGTTGANVIGPTASNYQQSSIGGGVITTASKDGATGNQIITFTGAYTGSSASWGMDGYAVSPTMVAGDIFEGILEAKILTDFSANVLNIFAYMQVFNSGFGAIAQSSALATTGGSLPFKAADGTFALRTPQVILPAGPVYMHMGLNITFAAGTATTTAGSIQFQNFAGRKCN